MTRSDTSDWPIAVFDWGTTNLRVHVVEANGEILATQCHRAGIKALAPRDFPATFEFISAELRQQFGCKSALLVGMVGSNLGWQEVAMQVAPVSLAALARNLEPIANFQIQIVPGISGTSAAHLPDMMRGEETQVFGAAALLESDSLHICLPGTHTKWVRLNSGQVSQISSAMTGELFQLLTTQSILASQMKGATAVEDLAGFDDGVAASASGAGISQLAFSVRPRAILGSKRDATNALSYLSGALIGAEIREMEKLAGITAIALVGDAALTRLYERAAHHIGIDTNMVEGGKAVAKGAALIRAAALA